VQVKALVPPHAPLGEDPPWDMIVEAMARRRMEMKVMDCMMDSVEGLFDALERECSKDNPGGIYTDRPA
jgi:hypothetical protein